MQDFRSPHKNGFEAVKWIRDRANALSKQREPLRALRAEDDGAFHVPFTILYFPRLVEALGDWWAREAPGEHDEEAQRSGEELRDGCAVARRGAGPVGAKARD